MHVPRREFESYFEWMFRVLSLIRKHPVRVPREPAQKTA